MRSKEEWFETYAATRYLAVFLVGFFLLSLGSSIFSPEAGGQGKNSPKLVITPAEVEYKRKVTVVFSGSGFKPKEELGIEVELGGVTSDVSFLMKPKPVVDERGAFSSKWVLDAEIRRKLFEPKTYGVEVVDASGTVLAKGRLAFKKVDEKAAKKKN
jgi:hypothetical protein